MQYFISLIISLIFLLFCSSLFSQEKVDTNTLTPKKATLDKIEVIRTNCKGICITIDGDSIKIGTSKPIAGNESSSPLVIAYINCESFYSTIKSFRFENVNQMANTVVGVLSMDGERPSILGARREGTAYYINEVRVLEGFMPDMLE